MKKLNLIFSLLLISSMLKAQTDWHLTGNGSTSASTDLVGTTDPIDLSFRTDNTIKMQLEATGELGLGVTSPASWLHIKSTGTKETFRTDVPANEDNYWRMFAQGNEYGRIYHLYGSGSATGFYMVAPRGNLRFGSGYGTGTVIPSIEITGTSVVFKHNPEINHWKFDQKSDKNRGKTP